MVDDQTIQQVITSALNKKFPVPWGAFPATDQHGMEYITFVNEETRERFIISILKGL